MPDLAPVGVTVQLLASCCVRTIPASVERVPLKSHGELARLHLKRHKAVNIQRAKLQLAKQLRALHIAAQDVASAFNIRRFFAARKTGLTIARLRLRMLVATAEIAPPLRIGYLHLAIELIHCSSGRIRRPVPGGAIIAQIGAEVQRSNATGNGASLTVCVTFTFRPESVTFPAAILPVVSQWSAFPTSKDPAGLRVVSGINGFSTPDCAVEIDHRPLCGARINGLRDAYWRSVQPTMRA